MAAYNGHSGTETVAHIERNIETAWPEAYGELTGRQYGQVMAVANISFHDGKRAAGAEVESGLVIVGQRSWPLDVLNRITVESYVLDDDYNREHGTAYTGTIVRFDGQEIARYPYAL
jgi:hypothetical protein